MMSLCAAYDLNLAAWDDEPLVVLAQECGYQPAKTELLLRHRERCGRLIGQLARRRGLRPADVEDALQDAVFGVLKAIARYDTRQLGRQKGCSFRAFLSRVVGDRFKDFVRHLWRSQRRCVFCPDVPDDGAWADHPARDGDPARTLERAELAAALREWTGHLGDRDRDLVHGLLAGLRLRAAASQVGISYDRAKRSWRKLRAGVPAQLRAAV